MMEGPTITTTVDRCLMVGFTEHVQRLRANEFGRDLFGIPAFEMLLDLYMNRGGRPRSLTSLTAASSASERNSQRIVHRMARRGLVDLQRDPSDGRRIIVQLSPEACELLDRFFDQMVQLVARFPARDCSGSEGSTPAPDR
ncbi:hypothetical protein Sbs19_40310 [Sphingobium sp. BS19]|nr:hypothetical protein Sbs19_40310 [Sphingobium sp. BS19]